MPELPDITVYIESLRSRLMGATLEGVRIAHPFVLRTYDPQVHELCKRQLVALNRIGKRIVLSFSGDIHCVIHLMLLGRLRWLAAQAKLPSRISLIAFDFPSGVLLLTEAGSKRQASVHLVKGEPNLVVFRRAGIEPLSATPHEFMAALRRRNHTLKRALTDPDIISGIGNSYSDEILHRAKLSPLARSQSLSESELARLYAACQSTLSDWIERLRIVATSGFPEHVSAFHPAMAVHGKFGLPCPTCNTKVQRIRYANNECNYCPTCQTQGRLLADRGLSRLLHGDWPKSLEELEERMGRQRQ